MTLVATLLTAACCSSLPRAAVKKLPFPAPRPRFESVIETSGHFFDDRRERDVPVRTYSPGGSHGPLPVVLFSHGIGEDRDSYVYLGRALARAGFYAVHLTHAGTDRAVLENWINRPLDVSFVLDRLASYEGIDIGHVAVVGHSAGAFTAFAVAGMQTADGESLRDPRVKVIVPMSMPRIAGSYDAIDIPVLNLTGTCDTSLVYRTFPRRQYLVTLKGVNHDMFSAREDPHHAAIAALTVAFLRAWLEDDAQSRAWFDDAGRGEAMGVRLSVERKAGTATAR